MKKTDRENFSYIPDLDDEERILLRSILDKARRANDIFKPLFSFFLDERKLSLSKTVLASEHFDNYRTYGGNDASRRCVLALLPEYYDESELCFPITAVTFSYRAVDKLSHRDILGTLMGLNIRRECIGDIYVGEGRSCVFVYNTVLDDTLLVSKIGRVGVKTEIGFDETLMQEEKFKLIEGTVSSLRVDSIVSTATGLSRDKSASLVRSGLVTCDYKTAASVSDRLETGVVFSVRGYGKFELLSQSPTKKDRIHITVKKYL